MASKGKYTEPQIKPLPDEWVEKGHTGTAEWLDQQRIRLGERILGGYHEDSREAGVVRKRAGHLRPEILLPAQCRICPGSPADGFFGHPNFNINVEDTRSQRSSAGLNAGATAGYLGNGKGHFGAQSLSGSSAGETTVNFDVTLPLAKLVLNDTPGTDKRFITCVVVGVSLKLRGRYNQKGKASKSRATSLSALAGLVGAGGGIGLESQQHQPGSATTWKVIEAKGIRINPTDLPSASKPGKVQKYLTEQLENARTTPEDWGVLFLDVNSDEFLTPEEHRKIGQFPNSGPAYLKHHLSNSLTNPLVKETLRCLYGLGPIDFTSACAESVPGHHVLKSKDPYQALADKMPAAELQLEEVSYGLIRNFSYFNNDGCPELTSKALKFWWGHLRLETTAQALVGSELDLRLQTMKGRDLKEPLHPYPMLPEGLAAKARIREGVLQATPAQRPNIAFEKSDDSDSEKSVDGDGAALTQDVGSKRGGHEGFVTSQAAPLGYSNAEPGGPHPGRLLDIFRCCDPGSGAILEDPVHGVTQTFALMGAEESPSVD